MTDSNYEPEHAAPENVQPTNYGQGAVIEVPQTPVTSTTPASVPPTQAKHPWRASLRTGLFVWLPLIVLSLSVVPDGVHAILDEAGKANVALPGWLDAALVGTSTITALLAAIINRILLLPKLNELLTALGIGPTPKDN